jgi:tight adherence protein B
MMVRSRQRSTPLAWRIARLRFRPDPAAGVDAIAVVAERLAVLLSAGVPASAAWAHLGDRASDAAGRAAAIDPSAAADASVLDTAGTAAAHGQPVAAAIERARAATPAASAEWGVLASAWSVAAESGAPLAGSLRDLATALRDEAQLRREIRTALAGPIASARLVLSLPIIAVLFGMLLGFDTIAVLVGNPIGLGCVVIGALLLWLGHRWSSSLAARASRSRADAGLELELLAIAMSGGASLDRARSHVREALAAHGVLAADRRAADEVVELAARAGAPVAELLRAEAFRLRRVARAEGAARAAALGVRLMLPLGACVLPAFVLVGVVPLLISVIAGTIGGAA